VMEEFFRQLVVEFPVVTKLKPLGTGEKSDLIKYIHGCGNVKKVASLIDSLANSQTISVSSTLDGVKGANVKKPVSNKSVCGASPRFIRFVSTAVEANMSQTNVVSQRFQQYGKQLGINPAAISFQSSKPGWRNSSFLSIYTGDYLYRQLNLDLRRFDAYCKNQLQFPLSAYEKSELPSNWQPTIMEQAWIPYIAGCLTNYTHERRAETSSKIRSKKLRRGFAIPVPQLPEYASNFPVNRVFYWPGFTSTSNKSSGFSGEVQVYITPHPKLTSGVDISSISQYAGECEVLFPPFTWFIVKSQTLTPSSLTLELEELSFFDYLLGF